MAGRNAHHYAPYVLSVTQEIAGFNVVLLIGRGELPHLQPLVGPVDCAHERGGRHPVTGHFGGIQYDANLPALAAYQLRLGNIINALDLTIDFTGNPAQRVAVVTIA